MRKLRRPILLVVLALVVVGVPACGLLQEAEGPTVEIVSPENFAKVQVGESVDVVSTSTDPEGVTKVELWVGEDLYLTNANPSPGGETTWTLIQTWTPTAPGFYTLTVVAFNADDAESVPFAVAIEAVEGPITDGTAAPTVQVGTPRPSTTTPPPGATTGPPGTVAPLPPPTNTPVPPPPTNTPLALADLYIAEFSMDPEAPRVGDHVLFRVVVRNGGNAPSGLFGVTVYMTEPPVQIITGQSGSLAPGGERVFTSPFAFSDAGLATVRAGIGISPMDQDGNEGNNTAELAIDVQEGGFQGVLPDLYINMHWLDPVTPHVGEEMEITVVVRNGGSAAAGTHVVDWMAGPSTLGCAWRVDGLGPGAEETKACTYTYTSPHTNLQTVFTADANGDVDESDEDNNSRPTIINVVP